MVSRSPVSVRTLDNGLQVLLREAHDAPIASFWVWYRVGSRNEVPGLTGISHWVEHMQFKGTPSLAKGAIFRDVSKNGGTLNALTSNDWTAYFETLPVDRLELSLAVESDRMTNSLFDPEETESERTVILSERQGAENGPSYRLLEEVFGVAFRAHPYGHMVIGHEADLRSITRDDLYAHYRRHYHPRNAFVVAVGDFDADELFGRIDRAFGQIAPGEPAAPVRAVEPPQRGERRVVLRQPAPTAYLRMAFKAPDARHPDSVPLLVADAVLSGGKGMGLAGGGPMGRSARFYRALVAGGLARGAGSDFDLTLDAGLFGVAVTALPGVELGRIEAAVDAELARLRDETVPEEELARALKQVRAQYVYSSAGVTNQAFWLGQMEVVDSYRRADALVDELSAVTPDDIQRVARTYLTPESRTVGWLEPSGDGAAAEGDQRVAAALPGPGRYWSIYGGTVRAGWDDRPETVPSPATAGEDLAAPAPAATGSRRAPFERVELPNGVVVLGQARPDDPVAVVRIRVEAGALAEPAEKAGLAAFTAWMLPRGQAGRTFEALNELTDGLGATLSVDAGRLSVDLAVRCLREDLPAMLDLAADVLLRPDFPADELEKVRREILAGIREADDNTQAVADRTLRELLYPDGHPYRRRVAGEAETVSTITRDDLVAYHATRYGPRVTTVAVVGGVLNLMSAAELLHDRFGGWDAPADPLSPPPPVAGPATTVREARSLAGKSQADIAIGFPTVARSHPAYYALDTANLILGRLGLMGRLGASVRDRQGLAYYVYSGLETGRDLGTWVARAGVDPKDVDQAIASITDEVLRLRQEPVEEEELADAQSYLTGVLPLALESNDGVAATLLSIEHFGLGLDYLDRYPGIIRALTRDELLEAAQRHLDPERLAVGVAGPAPAPA